MISVGVDIGSYSIKVAEVESTSKSFVIRRILEFPLSLDLTKDKKIEIIDTLRNLFQNYPVDKTHFVFALPQKNVSMRLLNFPFRERFKVQKSVAGQLEDDLPFSPEDAIFETKITRYIGKTSDVLAMAVPKEHVGEVLNTAHDCGVQPHLISVETLGLANLFERWSEPPAELPAVTVEVPGPRQAEILLNVGHRATQMLIYCEGIVMAIRNIDWGAKNLADAIAAKYNINYLQAMRELQLKGALVLDKASVNKDQAAFSQTLEDSAAELVATMRLKLLELQSEHNLQWTKGSTMGGGSQLKNLGAFLTQNFEIPFNRYKQFEFNSGGSADITPQIEAVSPVAVGLAIEALKRPRNPACNFLKGDFARQSDFMGAIWSKWGYTLQLSATAFAFLLAFGITRESLSLHLLDESDTVLHKQAEAIGGLKGKRASLDGIRKFINNIERDAKNRKQAEKVTHINSALDVLNLMSASLPPGNSLALEIKRINIDNNQAEVAGYVNSSSDVLRVQRALEKASINGKVESVSSRVAAPAGRTPFAFRLQVLRFSGG
jgi:general secretion pathway protein L